MTDAGPSDSRQLAVPTNGCIGSQGNAGDGDNSYRAYHRSQLVVIQDSDEEDANGQESTRTAGSRRGWFTFKKLFAFLGPGLLMSIAYVDPGNLESDLQAGAAASCSLLWLLLLSTMMGFVLQLLAARLGVVTGWDLAEHCRNEYPPVPRYLLWIQTEIAIIGSDIQEVIGSAIALNILSRGYMPLWAGVIVTSLDCFIFLYVEQGGIRKLEMLFGFFIFAMLASFGWMFYAFQPSALEISKGLFIPTLNKQNIHQATALLGSLIMPHNLFLHSSLVHSRHINTRRKEKVQEAVVFFGIESALSLGLTFIINMFVIAVFSAGFYGKSGEVEIGLGNAGRYLEERFGLMVGLIWALGLLAAGQSSTMTGTYTGQFVMCGFLELRIKPWQRTFVTRGVALLPTLAVALACRSPTALDTLTQALNVLQSVQLPFALIPLLTFTSSKRIMGYMVNSWPMMVVAWLIAIVCMSINGYLVVSQLEEIPRNFTFRFVFFAFLAFYLSFLAYLVISPSRLRHLQRMYGSAEISSPVAGTRFRNKFLAGDGLAEPSTSASTTEPLLQNSSQE